MGDFLFLVRKKYIHDTDIAIWTWQNRGFGHWDAFHGSFRCLARLVQMPCTTLRDASHRGITGISNYVKLPFPISFP